MLRVHRDFKGLLKDVQDEYDFLAEGKSGWRSV